MCQPTCAVLTLHQTKRNPPPNAPPRLRPRWEGVATARECSACPTRECAAPCLHCTCSRHRSGGASSKLQPPPRADHRHTKSLRTGRPPTHSARTRDFLPCRTRHARQTTPSRSCHTAASLVPPPVHDDSQAKAAQGAAEEAERKRATERKHMVRGNGIPLPLLLVTTDNTDTRLTPDDTLPSSFKKRTMRPEE